jgi:hypothetical protein
MYPDRLRSIVPMFGGGDSFVETLEATVTCGKCATAS